MSTIANLLVKLGANTNDFKKAMDDANAKVNSSFQSMTKAGKLMTAGLTVPIAGVATVFAKSAMDLEATEAKYNTVFGNMTADADEFIKKFQELTPATTAAARNMASGIQDLLIPMGFAREEATKMTGELFHVSGALANFNSGTHTAEQVTAAMQSAILGMYRPLASLGIQLDATTVRQKAVEMGLAATTDEVTKQHEVMVMIDQVYKQSGDALDAYTEANLDAKTKLGLLRAEAVDVAAAFGTHLIPFIGKTIDKVREGVDWFANLSEEKQLLILKIMGVTAVIGPLLMIFGQLAAAILHITTLTKGASVAFGLTKATGLAGAATGAGVAMAGIPVAAIVAGLGLVAGAVFALRREYDNMGLAAKRAADLSRASWSGLGGPGGVRDIVNNYNATHNARPGSTTSGYMDPRHQRGTTATTSSYMDPRLTAGGSTTASGFGTPTYNLAQEIADSIGGGSSGGGGGGGGLSQTMVDIMTKVANSTEMISRLLHVALAPVAYNVIDTLKGRGTGGMNQFTPAMEGMGSIGGSRFEHSGTITVQGVDSDGQLMGVVDIMIDDLRRELRAR